MTDKEWKELGCKPSLGREWQALMDGLWIQAQVMFLGEARNVENTIRISNWKIHVSFVNNDFLNVVLSYKDEERLEIRHTNNNKRTIIQCVFRVIDTTYKNPLK
ncbi:MAG: hypothetical protein ABGW97_15915 [Christiangramia sp.]|uniref:hypothetical protein n=1 Tax=Christiangramia sp. TaxID=1931228 RepID=UPI0032428D54